MIHVWFGNATHESAGKLAAWFSMHGEDARPVGRQEFLPTEQSSRVLVWGRKLPMQYQNTLNVKAPKANKLAELATLLSAGVPVPGISTHNPGTWLPRRSQHMDGSDLVNPGPVDFYVEPIDTTYEFRVNVFKGQVFRTGLKIPKPGTIQRTITTQINGVGYELPIRTGKNGWTWTYQQAPLDATNTNRAPMREAAIKAVAALEYDFGAVDVGYRPDGRWVVFEVNSAPALEGDDLGRYGQLILDHYRGTNA